MNGMYLICSLMVSSQQNGKAGHFPVEETGDLHSFCLFENGQKCGSIDIGAGVLNLEINSSTYCCEPDDESVVQKAFDILLNAVLRDDNELASKASKNGKLTLPEDYEDISREDVLTGQYTLKR